MFALRYSALAAILLAIAPALKAEGPGLSEKFYEAVRADDKQAVKQLIAGGADVNTRDARGTNPLMYASAAGSVEMMRLLIAAGADVRAKNGFDATALMWCSNRFDKVWLLVEKGADVNARSKRGRTPLLIAATHDGNVEVVRLLLSKGADPAKARDNANSTPLIEAASANDTATVKLLLERGEDPKAKNAGGFTALMFAAIHGNAEVTKALLARGAEVNAQTQPTFGRPLRHGSIALGNLTPLMLAVTGGSPETVKLLLKAGAIVNAKDVRGMTPMMFAAATDHPNDAILQALRRKGESPVPPAHANTGKPEPAASPQPDQHNVRDAAEKGIALLQKTTGTFFKESGCVSCHSHNITTVAAAAARPKGIHIDEAAAADIVHTTRLQFAAAGEAMLERLGPPAIDILTYALFALAEEGSAPDRVTDMMVHYIAAQQQADGSWGLAGIVRPPMSDGRVSETAMAIRALRQYAPPARQQEMNERIARAVKWLEKMQPRTTEDTVMQLLGVSWASANRTGMDRTGIRALVAKVLVLQRADGGWAQKPGLPSDAYATGTALYALAVAGNSPGTEPARQKGVAYLLKTQAADGSWFVASRSPKFQPYFESGFPYGHNQWISQMATGWASVALSLAAPSM